MQNNLDKLNKQYLINADLYNVLKYMTMDFMADINDINPECVERKMEIDELINDIDSTKQYYELVRDHASAISFEY